jgi:hypothetical protein
MACGTFSLKNQPRRVKGFSQRFKTVRLIKAGAKIDTFSFYRLEKSERKRAA